MALSQNSVFLFFCASLLQDNTLAVLSVIGHRPLQSAASAGTHWYRLTCVQTSVLSRAATNVRTFEYYSFEIFTNELFLRTNVRWRPLVYFWLKHCGAKFRPRAWEPCARACKALLLKSCADACHVPESSRERSGNMNFQLEEKHERQSF